jgi:hypothetical protein
MPELNKMAPSELRAALKGGTEAWGQWSSAESHVRYSQSAPPKSRRRCLCGCKRGATHLGMANGVALMSGCELVVARWVRGSSTTRRAGC